MDSTNKSKVTTIPATITASQLQQQVGSVLRRVGANGEHITVLRDGFPIAVLVPYSDYKADQHAGKQPAPKIGKPTQEHER